MRFATTLTLLQLVAITPILLIVSACGSSVDPATSTKTSGDASALASQAHSQNAAGKVTLTAIAGGRYLPGLFDQAGFVSIGQGQAGWFAFDLGPVAGARLRAMILSFTQVGTTNSQLFPTGLTVDIYDVTTAFDRLNVDRIPIDAEGEQIATDLRTGKVYASFVVTADGEGTRQDIALNHFARHDLRAAIKRGDKVFSIGLASVAFDSGGYFEAHVPALEVLVCDVERKGADSDGGDGCQGLDERLTAE